MTTSEKQRGPLYGLIKSMRPTQWVKNLFVLAPLVFALQLFSVPHVLKAVLGMFLFCMISGTVYLMNDVFDVEKDRQHPTKKNRPIAAGILPVKMAVIACVVIGLGSLGASFAIDWRFGTVALVYLIVNVLYSIKLKHVVFIDVITIALGFLFRTMAGAFIIDVAISEWLFGCTFLLALYLALGKRKHEMIQAGTRRGKQRRVLERYRLDYLNHALLGTAGLTIAAYTAYTLSVSLPDKPWHSGAAAAPDAPYLYVTIPFAIAGIMRFYMLVSKAESADSPTDRMIRDIPFILNLAIWGVSVLAMLYAKVIFGA